MQISLQWDERSVKQMNYFITWGGHWHQHMHDELTKELAEAAKEYYKPFVKSKRGTGTGLSAESVRYEIHHTGDEATISYYGNLGAFYMDEGNFDPTFKLEAPKGKVKKAFPIGMREGATERFSPYIHGMGHTTPGVPTHATQKTVDWLENGKAADLALKSMVKWLESVVIGA